MTTTNADAAKLLDELRGILGVPNYLADSSIPGHAKGIMECLVSAENRTSALKGAMGDTDLKHLPIAGFQRDGIRVKVIPSDPTTVDMVNHPPHYNQGAIECLDAIASALGPVGFLAYLRGCVIKYMWRLGLKGPGKQDAEKAAFYSTRAAKAAAELAA